MAKKKTKTLKDFCDETLMKIASGFEYCETAEEFVADGGALTLVKSKRTKKYVPPDINALKLLIVGVEPKDELSRLSDEELENEKKRLLLEIAAQSKVT